MKMTYDLDDVEDRRAAGLILAKLQEPDLELLRQLTVYLRERDLRREVSSDQSLDRINGRLAGMQALLNLIRQLSSEAVQQPSSLDEIRSVFALNIGAGPV